MLDVPQHNLIYRSMWPMENHDLSRWGCIKSKVRLGYSDTLNMSVWGIRLPSKDRWCNRKSKWSGGGGVVGSI